MVYLESHSTVGDTVELTVIWDGVERAIGVVLAAEAD